MTDEQAKLWAERSTAEHYWKIATKSSAWFKNKLKEFEPFESIYEVGCNSGRNLFHLSSYKKVGGIDINREAIEFARSKMTGAFEVGEIQGMDVKEKYDIVFTCGVLLHIPPDDISDVLKKIAEKANKYIIHMETNGDGTIENGPKEFKPILKVAKKLMWYPNIGKLYKKLGFKAKIGRNESGARDAHNFIVVKVT